MTQQDIWIIFILDPKPDKDDDNVTKGWTIRYPGRGVSDPKKKFMQEIELEKKIPA